MVAPSSWVMKTRTRLLAVQRVGGDRPAGGELDLLEQRLKGGDFVALHRDRHLVERQAQMMGDGRRRQ